MISVPPLIALDTWDMRKAPAGLRPKAKCFLVMEGSNTEFWYFSDLVAILAKKNLPKTLEIKPVRRTGDDRGKSNPKALADQAQAIWEDPDGAFGFDGQTDSVAIVFDADIYKGNESEYLKDLHEFETMARVMVTNPSFELFLLLHRKGSLEEYVEPNCDDILRNRKAKGSSRRCVEKLASSVLEMNVKGNRRIGSLAEDFATALEQESRINQDPEKAMGRLTSNVALTISEIVREGEA